MHALVGREHAVLFICGLVCFAAFNFPFVFFMVILFGLSIEMKAIFVLIWHTRFWAGI